MLLTSATLAPLHPRRARFCHRWESCRLSVQGHAQHRTLQRPVSFDFRAPHSRCTRSITPPSPLTHSQSTFAHPRGMSFLMWESYLGSSHRDLETAGDVVLGLAQAHSPTLAIKAFHYCDPHNDVATHPELGIQEAAPGRSASPSLPRGEFSLPYGELSFVLRRVNVRLFTAGATPGLAAARSRPSPISGHCKEIGIGRGPPTSCFSSHCSS